MWQDANNAIAAVMIKEKNDLIVEGFIRLFKNSSTRVSKLVSQTEGLNLSKPMFSYISRCRSGLFGGRRLV